MERAPPGFGARQALDEVRAGRRPTSGPGAAVRRHGRWTVAITVVVVEPRAGDELGDGLAAVAADRLLAASMRA